MGRCGVMAVLVLAAGCAAVTGLDGYEVTGDGAINADGGTPPGGDAGFSGDSSVLPRTDGGDGAAPGDGGGPTTLDAGPLGWVPTCARTTCAGVASCVADDCDGTKQWNSDGVSRQSGFCRAKADQSSLSASLSFQNRNAFTFELGASIGFDAADGANEKIRIIEIGTATPLVLLTATESGSYELCTAGSAAPKCTGTIKVTKSDLKRRVPVDIYGRYDDGQWTVYLAVDGAACDGAVKLTIDNTKTVGPELRARVGNFGGDDAILTLDDLTFSVTPR